MSAVITPTPGRIVWYWPAPNDNIPALAGQPLAAIVAAVHSDRYINLCVIDAYGNHHSRQNVFLSQSDEDAAPSGFAEWMPYQKGQAAKVEQVQSALAAAISTDGVGVTTPAMFAETDGTSASETGLVNTSNDSAEQTPGADASEEAEAQQ